MFIFIISIIITIFHDYNHYNDIGIIVIIIIITISFSSMIFSTFLSFYFLDLKKVMSYLIKFKKDYQIISKQNAQYSQDFISYQMMNC